MFNAEHNVCGGSRTLICGGWEVRGNYTKKDQIYIFKKYFFVDHNNFSQEFVLILKLICWGRGDRPHSHLLPVDLSLEVTGCGQMYLNLINAHVKTCQRTFVMEKWLENTFCPIGQRSTAGDVKMLNIYTRDTF